VSAPAKGGAAAMAEGAKTAVVRKMGAERISFRNRNL